MSPQCCMIVILHSTGWASPDDSPAADVAACPVRSRSYPVLPRRETLPGAKQQEERIAPLVCFCGAASCSTPPPFCTACPLSRAKLFLVSQSKHLLLFALLTNSRTSDYESISCSAGVVVVVEIRDHHWNITGKIEVHTWPVIDKLNQRIQSLVVYFVIA
jgi:hypothetical protein